MTAGIGSKSGMLSKRIPTLVGLGILVVGLVVGVILLGTGTNVFAPRATPETTPKQIRITNITDTGFSVSFATDESTPGFLKYGTEERKISTQSPDDRDKLTGSVESFFLHHITVGGLQPDTQYYYLLGTGGGTTFDNNGSPFIIKTAPRGGTPSAAKTAYGSVSTESGSPADGAVVYISIEGVGELSTLVKSSGSWAVPLSNARTKDSSAYAQITEDAILQIEVKGVSPQQQLRYQTAVNNSQPIAALQFGKSAPEAIADAGQKIATQAAALDELGADATKSARGGGIGDLLAEDDGLTATELNDEDALWYGANSTASATLSLENEKHQLINTDQPTFTGIVPPNVTVTIEIHSETEITQQLISNPDGSFSLNIEELGKTLEPGEHTVTYSYEDPNTGQTVTKTQTFTVKPKTGTSNQLAQANPTPSPTPTPKATPTPSPSPSPSPTPFGSGNPYPVGGSASQSASKSAAATKSAGASGSARTSMPSTASGVPVSGSVGTTMTLVIGGLFFLFAGAWSFWISKEYVRQEE
jgi:hypothetical protein